MRSQHDGIQENKDISAVALRRGSLCTLCRGAKKPFTIYEFIPYHEHVIAGQLSTSPPFREYLETLEIHPVDVVYDKRYLTDGQPDEKKIEAVAKAALASKTLVSFDTEFGDRFDP